MVVVGVSLIAAIIVFLRWERRRATLARLRSEWGKPKPRTRDLHAIAEYHRSRVVSEPAGRTLDDRTWEDLNLDAVFAGIDRTESALGQQALYHRLRTAPVPQNLDAFEALVSRFSADPPARERAQTALARLQDRHGYDLWWLGRSDAVETESWYVIFPILSGAALVVLSLAPLWFGALPGLVVVMGINAIIRRTTDRRIGALAGAFRQLAPLIATAESLGYLDGDEVEPIVGSLRSEVRGLARLKMIARWVSGDPFMLSPEAGGLAIAITDAVSVVYEYFNLFFLLDANAVYFGAAELRAHGAPLLRVIAAMGEVDAAISVASLRTGSSAWTRPEFRRAGAPATFETARHPLLDMPVPSSIELGPPYGLLVTGSNMSGKTTFLRTLGVTAIMAQTIGTCFANRYAAPILQVRSCIGRSDDLVQGKSYYVAEVEAVLSLVHASESIEPHLFLFDELFRGTNAVERVAAGEAVLRHLTASWRHLVVAATHDGDLVDLLADCCVPCHFTDRLGPDGLEFDYRLSVGPATTRNAIALLKLHGAPEHIVSGALVRAAALDRIRSG